MDEVEVKEDKCRAAVLIINPVDLRKALKKDNVKDIYIRGKEGTTIVGKYTTLIKTSKSAVENLLKTGYSIALYTSDNSGRAVGTGHAIVEAIYRRQIDLDIVYDVVIV